MSTLDLTASNVDGGCDDLIRCQLVEKQADGGDIGDSVHGADFMEVDLAYRFVVSFAFGFRDEAIDRQDIGTNGFRKFQVVDDMMDVVEAAVGVIVMMVMGVTVVMRVVMVVVMGVTVVMSVVMLVVVVTMLVGVTMPAFFLLCTVYGNGQVGPGDTAFYGWIQRNVNTGDPGSIELRGKSITRIIWQEFCQGGSQHIPCGTHAAV